MAISSGQLVKLVLANYDLCNKVLIDVDNMARKSLIESSDHFDEIVERLSRNETGKDVSEWLKNTYNEEISPRTLNRYKATKINMEARVEAELNKRAQKKKELDKKRKSEKLKAEKEQSKKLDNATSKVVQSTTDIEENIKTVSETIADNMQGVAKVAAEFPSMFEKAKKDARDPDSNVTSKDVARLALDANKLYNDYFKDTSPDVEVNVNNEVIGLSDSIEASRQKYVKWKEEQLQKKE